MRLSLLLLELLDVVPMLGRLLNHRVELLLRHLNNWQLSHLRVSNYGRLLQELVLEAREHVFLSVLLYVLLGLVLLRLVLRVYVHEQRHIVHLLLLLVLLA